MKKNDMKNIPDPLRVQFEELDPRIQEKALQLFEDLKLDDQKNDEAALTDAIRLAELWFLNQEG